MTDAPGAEPDRTRPPSFGRSAMISGGARLTAQVITWLVTLMTVRLLAPADYGQAGLAMTIAFFASLVVDLGMAPAIQAMPEQSPRVLRQANGLTTFVALAMAALLTLGGPVLANYFGEARLRTLMVAAGLHCLLEGLRAVPTAVALRSFRFGAVARADFVRALVGSGVTILLAWQGQGAWSVVGGAIAGSAVALAILQWDLRLSLAIPTWRQLSPLIAYGRLLLLGRLTWQGWVNADGVIVGRTAAMAALGHFNVAKTFAQLPQEKLLSVFMGVTQSYLAAAADDRPALRRYFLELTELIAVGMGLPLLGLLATAHDVLPLVLGPNWHEAAPLVQWLIPGAFLSCLGSLANQVVIIRGRAAIPTAASTVAAVVAFPWFWGCAQIAGPRGVAAGTLAISLLINGPGLVDALRQTGATAAEFAGRLRPLVLSGGLMLASLWGGRLLLQRFVSPDSVLSVACLVALGGTVGVFVALRVGGTGVDRLRTMLRLPSPSRQEAA